MNPDIVEAVATYAGGTRINVSRLCREQSISRNTFYALVHRFRDEGASAFTARSTRPNASRTATTPEVHEAIVRVRKELDDEGLDNGPISIRWRLQDQDLDPVPSRSTIYRVLTDHGLIIAEPRKKPRTRRSFEFSEPNGCWQIDGLEHYLADGTTVCILQILDDHSRLDVCSFAARAETSADAWTALQRAMNGYGIPPTCSPTTASRSPANDAVPWQRSNATSPPSARRPSPPPSTTRRPAARTNAPTKPCANGSPRNPPPTL
ncbi:helix-turn-helix domain-containing protein [Rhodococcus sp. NPDC058521]|uniref:helix-turn-helix domain-containing protein n=1 Tax=Rhodococcus sp. NPDC058521 TaxID=3346536 RepID=UPI0036479E5E